jgi:hypothetical protein
MSKFVVVEQNAAYEPIGVHGMFPERWRAQAWANKYLLARAHDWLVMEVSEELERVE